MYLTTSKICLEIFKLDPARPFSAAPRLAWQAVFKRTKIKLDLLTDTDTLLMVEKGIRGGIYGINIWLNIGRVC